MTYATEWEQARELLGKCYEELRSSGLGSGEPLTKSVRDFLARPAQPASAADGGSAKVPEGWFLTRVLVKYGFGPAWRNLIDQHKGMLAAAPSPGEEQQQGTPRTDAHCVEIGGDDGLVYAEFARQLERELALAKDRMEDCSRVAYAAEAEAISLRSAIEAIELLRAWHLEYGGSTLKGGKPVNAALDERTAKYLSSVDKSSDVG